MMFMKKGIVGFIFILMLIFSSMLVMVFFDSRYVNDIENKIIKNTDISDIVYVNDYEEKQVPPWAIRLKLQPESDLLSVNRV